MRNHQHKFFDSKMLKASVADSLWMLNPMVQIKNPVMFVTYLGAISTTLYVVNEYFNSTMSWFDFQITLWLWFTVLFANFAQAIAESRGKAQAASLRKTKVETFAKQVRNGVEVKIPSSDLTKGDIIVCETGDIIPADGEVVEGIATVDESAITGESAPVIRESGGDRSAVTAGTKILSDRLIIRVTSEPGSSLDRKSTRLNSSHRL